MHKNVRQDVIKKLVKGLRSARVDALYHKASFPNSYKYRTNRCDHYIYHDQNTNTYYFNTVEFDGTRRHTTLQYGELFHIIGEVSC